MTDGRQYQAGSRTSEIGKRDHDFERAVEGMDEMAVLSMYYAQRNRAETYERRAQRSEAECERLQNALQNVWGALQPCPEQGEIAMARSMVSNALATSPHEREPEQAGWYCGHCDRGVDPSEVTFHEAHEACGRIITDDSPPEQSSTMDHGGVGHEPEQAIGNGRNPHYEGTFEGETEEQAQARRLSAADPTPEQAHGDARDVECPCCSGRGTLASQKERYRVMNAMIQQWSVSQQNGDALADAYEALEQLQEGCESQEAEMFGNVGGAKDLADKVRRHLTASGVPYVPDEVRRLPSLFRGRARCNQQHPGHTFHSEVYEKCADELERALASAPAVHPKYTRATMKELRSVYGIVLKYIDKLSDPISESEFNLDAAQMCDDLNDVFAAAPQRGGE